MFRSLQIPNVHLYVRIQGPQVKSIYRGCQRSKGRWEFMFNNFKTDQHRHLQVLHQGYSFQHYHLGPGAFSVVKDNPVQYRIFQQYLCPTGQKPVAPVVKIQIVSRHQHMSPWGTKSPLIENHCSRQLLEDISENKDYFIICIINDIGFFWQYLII